jgi:hypothetical protein
MNDTSGPTSPTPLAYLDPDGSSWRTSQGTLLSEDQPLLERLPNWGMTQDSVLYELPMPERLTNANDFSSLPTPTARDYKDTGPNTNYEKIAAKKRLAGTIAMLPTPTAQAGKHGSTPDVTANSYGKNLWDLPHLLPTPTAWVQDEVDMDKYLARRERVRKERNNGNGFGLPLDMTVRLLGESTQQPSTDGNTSSDEPPHPQ